MKQVCKDCPDRVVGCHSTCERYIEAKTEHNEIAAIIRKKQNEELDTDIYVADAVRAIKNSRRLRRR